MVLTNYSFLFFSHAEGHSNDGEAGGELTNDFHGLHELRHHELGVGSEPP